VVSGCPTKREALRRAVREAQRIHPDISAHDVLRCRCLPRTVNLSPTEDVGEQMPSLHPGI
jgi:hypothetical protein